MDVTSPRADRRLATVTIPAPDLAPAAFLRHADGGPRGFWARGERWVAHAGAVAELGAGHSAGEDRFAAVAAAAERLARNPLPAPGRTRAPRARFYGGFSFREDHAAAGAWSAFPAARFHLPELELEGDGSGDAWLRVRSLVDPADAADAFGRLRRRAELVRAELSAAMTPVPRSGRIRAEVLRSDREAWRRAVEESLQAIRAGRVSKVVLARTLDVSPAVPLDPAEVVEHLWEVNRGSHVFLYEPVAGAALVGAAPETVATLRDGVFHATAVAGSIGRGADPREAAELAARLLASQKDREEQRIALDDMVARLRTIARQIRTDPQPHVLTLARIQHLETEIRASVDDGTGVLDLLRLLHPTAAVCGLPRDEALAFLAGAEPFERGWYAGPVGWFDGDGNGVFAPALRTAVLHAGTWRLFAGAGIVEGSVPEAEWAETGLKFTPVLEAMEGCGLITEGIGAAATGGTGKA